MRWKSNAKHGDIVAGGKGYGDRTDHLNEPQTVLISIFVDVDQSVYISHRNNHRVIKWMKNAREGTVVVGGPFEGTSLELLSWPSRIMVVFTWKYLIR